MKNHMQSRIAVDAIALKNICKNFRGKMLFNNFSWYVPFGEIVGLTGINGSGKTTLIKIICGLIRPDSGEVIIDGFDINTQRTAVMHQIGVLFDDTRNLYWKLSARDNIIYFCSTKHIFGKLANDRAAELLVRFNLLDFRDEKVEALSFGTKRRLALACAIVHNPKIILLDEPTNGLDKKSKNIFDEWLQDLTENKKNLTIITSHDQTTIDTYCTIAVSIHDLNNVKNNL